jgi:hypothetical protein
MLAWTTFLDTVMTVQSAMLADAARWQQTPEPRASEVVPLPSSTRPASRRSVTATVVPLRPR